ncbi:lamin tail domain-containing protein [Candidatus Pacearchaeota archaeon]|nr:lamin tail domain-containing protein [Candidatus Pacearchaeota archaeon]
MKRILLPLLLIILISNISAIRINEFESNPEGPDTGNEWVELYDRGDIDLEGYKLVNNDGDEIVLSGSFSKYYVYTFDKQWLDNKDEGIFLYKDGELVDETDVVDDGANDDFAWSYCSKDWEFVEETKDGKNDCKKEEDQDESDSEIQLTNNVVQETPTAQPEPQVISLGAKDIKSEKDKKNLDKSDYALYGFIGFCILLIVLFIIKSTYNKNEFE